MSDDQAVEREGPSLKELIVRLSGRDDLAADEAHAAFGEVMAGRASQIQVAGLLVGLRTKGEVAAEVAGGVRALREAMVPVVTDDPDSLVDTCGTGGGDVTTFNISTAAALLAAGMGIRIAKHGNRSFTSRCGSADVLEALGVDIELTPEAMSRVLAEAGIVFMFAPLLHPAMRHVAPVRRELGMPTIMNLLGPLTNPAGARRQVVGVTGTALLDLVAGALRELGHDRALVVHGAPGLDELSPIGDTHIAELKDGEVNRYSVEPGMFGWDELNAADLAGGDPADNARVILEIFRGERHDAARAAVALNAGAAAYVGGIADSLEDGVRQAAGALDDGAGMEGLERLRIATTRAREEP
ncbi:MAG TPA: anthranilate phosphoribosyltransferase [Longimicrobiales bacterium]|nr:anthranilate phosphoribosyltransferase [Longimicrobiales bacterium]